MRKSILIGACLALGLTAGLGGCATQASSATTVAANNPACVQDTGTRIQDPNRKCVNQPGAAYTQRDIQQTGEIDSAEALKKLDPRLQ